MVLSLPEIQTTDGRGLLQPALTAAGTHAAGYSCDNLGHLASGIHCLLLFALDITGGHALNIVLYCTAKATGLNANLLARVDCKQNGLRCA
jgi:hypothetical protein